MSPGFPPVPGPPVPVDEAYDSGKGTLEVIRASKALDEEQITHLLDPVQLTGLDRSQDARH